MDVSNNGTESPSEQLSEKKEMLIVTICVNVTPYKAKLHVVHGIIPTKYNDKVK